jgi:hypothetical protein
MKIEQTIAAAFPAMEVQLNSFEEYEEAFQFCKDERDVGFFLISESVSTAPFLSVFRELADLHQGSLTPAFGAIFHENEPQAYSAKLVGKNDTLVDYIPVTDLLDPKKVSFTINSLWASLVEAYQKTVFSKDLQASILSVAESEIGVDAVHFLTRVAANLTSDLNVTWTESIAANWGSILALVSARQPALLKPHERLLAIIDSCGIESSMDETNLVSMLGSKESLIRKTVALAGFLEKSRSEGKLVDSLRSLASRGKPGAPKLIRHVAKNSERILEMASDAQSLHQERKIAL